MTTEALLFLNTLDPETIGPNLEYATHYEPTPVRDIRQLLDGIPQPLEETTFVDVGSGMGRVVMLAAQRPFKMIVGVEISGALHEVARENLKHFDREKLRCHDVRLVHGDAAEYRFPRGRLAVYLYNPFRAQVLEQMVERLLARSGDVRLIYHTPVEREVLDRNGALELLDDLGFAAVYATPGS